MTLKNLDSNWKRKASPEKENLDRADQKAALKAFVRIDETTAMM